jgi:hypothetical protein
VAVAVSLDGQTFTTVTPTFEFDSTLVLDAGGGQWFYTPAPPAIATTFVAIVSVDAECVAFEMGPAADAALDALTLMKSANAAYMSTGVMLPLSGGFPDTLVYTVDVYTATSQVLKQKPHTFGFSAARGE